MSLSVQKWGGVYPNSGFNHAFLEDSVETLELAVVVCRSEPNMDNMVVLDVDEPVNPLFLKQKMQRELRDFQRKI